MPNLSDFDPADVQPTAQPEQVAANAPAPFSLKDLKSEDVSFVPGGEQEAKYGGLGSNILGGIEGGLNAVTFGISGGMESALQKQLQEESDGEYNNVLGMDLSSEAQKARAEQNPLSSITGQVLGFATNLGAAGAIKGAGALASEGIANKALSTGIKYGVENALIQGENEVGKMLQSDPNQTLGTAAINMGLAGVIGGGIGAGAGAAGGLWSAKFGNKTASALDAAGANINGEVLPAISQDLGQVELNDSSGITDLKPNSSDISQSMDRLGINEPSPGILSNSPLIQNMEGNLAERPSFAGVALNKERGQIFDKLAEAGESTLKGRTDLSAAQVGRQVKEGLAEELNTNLKPIEAEYKALKPEFKSIDIGDDLKLQAIDPIANHEYVKLDPGAASVAKTVSNQIEAIENVDQLKTVRSLIADKLNTLYNTGSGSSPEAQILQTAKNALTDMRAKALQSGVERGIVSPDIMERIAAVDAQYASFQNTVKQLGVEGGLGKANNARALLERFGKLSDESFAKKIFDVKDVNQLNFFKQNFPKEYELARRFKLGEIRDASIDHAQGKNGRFDTSKFLSQVRKLGPEARDAVFDGTHGQKIQDMERVFQALPGTPNTSKTSYSEAFAHLLSPAGVVRNLSDTAQYAFLKALPHLKEAASHVGGDEAAELAALKFATSTEKGANPQAFKAMADYIRATIKGENVLSNGINNIFDAGKAVLPSHLIPSEKDVEKLDKKLKGLQANNSELFNAGEHIGHYLPDHAQALAQTGATAVNYLNGLRPVATKANPLDRDIEPTPAQNASFHRSLTIAQQPMVVLNHLKEGTLQPKDIETVKTIYPGLYSRMSEKIYSGMIEHVHAGESVPYKTRMSMSLFLAHPLDSTMTPASIMAAQPNAQPQAQQQASTQPQPRNHSMKNITKLAQNYATPEQAREAHKIAKS